MKARFRLRGFWVFGTGLSCRGFPGARVWRFRVEGPRVKLVQGLGLKDLGFRVWGLNLNPKP